MFYTEKWIPLISAQVTLLNQSDKKVGVKLTQLELRAHRITIISNSMGKATVNKVTKIKSDDACASCFSDQNANARKIIARRLQGTHKDC
jgi:hypothetical protein